MRAHVAALLILATSVALQADASAQGPVSLKIGMITTLSGPGSYLGEEIRNGFDLALEEKGGRLGGVPISLVVEDDGAKPQRGTEIAGRMLKSDGIKIFTGILFSNVAAATVPDILDADALYISPNSALAQFAGKECNRRYFAVAWQNDNPHEAAGQTANELGFKRAFTIVPNYQGGKDALAGFRRYFKGEIVGEIFTKLDQTDFAAELAQVRAAKPDVVYQFQPGGLGITFLRQYQQAGLPIPMVLSSSSVDEVTLKAVGSAAEGIYVASHWFPDFDNPQSKNFVEKYQKKYGRTPTYYASQSYDVAQALDAGLAEAGGDGSKLDAIGAGIRKAAWKSVRGPFRFGKNQHPIQDWYAGLVERDVNNALTFVTKRKVFSEHADVYAADCKL